MLKSPTKAERKTLRRRHLRNLRLLFSAWHFLHTSRDGAVIAHIVGVKPIDLYRWSESPRWMIAIRAWNPEFKGDTQLQGDYFKTVVGDSIVERSLKHASQIWTALFEGRETHKLQKTLRMFQEMGFTE